MHSLTATEDAARQTSPTVAAQQPVLDLGRLDGAFPDFHNLAECQVPFGSVVGPSHFDRTTMTGAGTSQSTGDGNFDLLYHIGQKGSPLMSASPTELATTFDVLIVPLAVVSRLSRVLSQFLANHAVVAMLWPRTVLPGRRKQLLFVRCCLGNRWLNTGLGAG
jgi:hypothetical protein